jgi:hypothetical protein
MLYYDVLDDIADGSGIPNEVHPYLHVIPKYAWVEVMVDMIPKIQSTKLEIGNVFTSSRCNY